MTKELSSAEVVTFSTLALGTLLSVIWSGWMRLWELEEPILGLGKIEGREMDLRKPGVVLAINSLWSSRLFLSASVFIK